MLSFLILSRVPSHFSSFGISPKPASSSIGVGILAAYITVHRAIYQRLLGH